MPSSRDLDEERVEDPEEVWANRLAAEFILGFGVYWFLTHPEAFESMKSQCRDANKLIDRAEGRGVLHVVES